MAIITVPSKTPSATPEASTNGGVNIELLKQQIQAVFPSRLVDMCNVSDYGATITVGLEGVEEAGDAAAISAIVTAHNPAELTPEQQAAAYNQLNMDYKDVFIQASNVLELGIANMNPVTLAAYRAVLTSVLQELAPLVGTRFQTHFDLERQAQSLTMTVGTMTLAQCGQFDNLLHVWLTARKTDYIITVMGL